MRFSNILSVLLMAISGAQAYVYCHWYANGDCTGAQSVDFSVQNSGCFRAAGKSFQCHGSTRLEFKLIQSPNNNDNCNCQDHCNEFNFGDFNPGPCHNLGGLGYNTNFDTYRFISGLSGVKCGSNNCG